MCVHVHVCVYVRMCIYTCGNVFYMYMDAFNCMRFYAYMCACICIYIYMHACMYTCYELSDIFISWYHSCSTVSNIPSIVLLLTCTGGGFENQNLTTNPISMS